MGPNKVDLLDVSLVSEDSLKSVTQGVRVGVAWSRNVVYNFEPWNFVSVKISGTEAGSQRARPKYSASPDAL